MVVARQEKPVVKYVLDNGMTLLVRPVHTIPKVSLQLWYGVGSKHETDRERGIAHLIEHMIFKGTHKRSESDIDSAIHKLSGTLNAFTSYDYTGYLFNLPKQHWHEALSIMADCMENCTFKEDMLSSEMKAVIQELKMYKDNYVRSLIDDMIGTIFSEHPYHHPIIGYKQDLWSVSSADLKAFYKKHYVPNNATLVVVGDVDPQEVYQQACTHFNSINPDENYKHPEHYRNEDVVARSVVLHRDVQEPVAVYAFVTPGSRDKKDNVLDFLSSIIGGGKSSRLYKKLVDELEIATSVSASAEELFDYGLFFILVTPKHEQNLAQIEDIIKQELHDIAISGVEDQELSCAMKKTQMGLYSLLEDTENQAYEIGKYFLATGDENYVFNFLEGSVSAFKADIQRLVERYFRPVVMHKGFILPLPEAEKPYWQHVQDASDKEDNDILSLRQRNTAIEKPSYSLNIVPGHPVDFVFPKSDSCMINNNIKLIWAENSNVPKVDIVVDFKAKHYFDPEDKQGLSNFVAKMLVEGTQKYTAREFAQIVECRGMRVSTFSGGIVMSALAEDLPFALDILSQMLSHATFDPKAINKVRAHLESDIRQFWDDPKSIASLLTKQEIYKNHPFSKNSLGTQASIASITRDDLVAYYKKYISPSGTRIAIVGDIKAYDVPALVKEKLASWQGPQVEDIAYPTLVDMESRSIDYPINRDQVVLTFAGLSISRKDPRYDQFLLFDQIFGGGVLGAMSSRLFSLREQSGLFYTISGSLLANAAIEPGMLFVRTIVSLDRLKEAEDAIKKTIDEVADTITSEELEESKRAIVHSLVDYFASNYSMANAYLYLDKYGFPADYFDKRAKILNSITLDDVKCAVKKMLKSDKLITLRVGRMAKETRD